MNMPWKQNAQGQEWHSGLIGLPERFGSAVEGHDVEAKMSVTSVETGMEFPQLHKFWLKIVAPLNIEATLVAEPKFHSSNAWLKTLAPLNVPAMFVTRLTSQLPRS